MSQLQGIEQKEVIKRVTGKIVKLWEPKTFKGPKGEFEIQGGAIEIDGQEYGLKFFENNQNASILEGKVVTISCSRGKHGFTGVTLDHESFSKKDGTKVDRDVIKVTKTGKVELGEGTEELPVAKAATPVSHGSQDAAKSLDDLVMQHLYINDLVRAAYSSKGYDEETLRSYVASVFIEANKKGIQVATPEAPKQSVENDWASFIVPSGSMKGKKLIDVGKKGLIDLYHHYWKVGFKTDFAKAVEKAGQVFNLPLPEEDNITMEDQPDIPW